MHYLLEFFIRKFFTRSSPIKISNDVLISEWKYRIREGSFFSLYLDVTRYINDNKFHHPWGYSKGILGYDSLVKGNRIDIHHSYCVYRPDGSLISEWRIWFFYNTWLSEAYKKMYGDYDFQRFKSLKEAQSRVDTFLHKIQTLKCFL